jgi:hypothetical protein
LDGTGKVLLLHSDLLKYLVWQYDTAVMAENARSARAMLLQEGQHGHVWSAFSEVHCGPNP